VRAEGVDDGAADEARGPRHEDTVTLPRRHTFKDSRGSMLGSATWFGAVLAP
jgi:hypothetical protein